MNNYKKDSSDKVAIFYHLYQAPHWIKLYQEQINSLIVSGLYEKCDFIHIGINGDEELPFVLDKMKVHYNQNKILEANTLQSLWEFCNSNLDYKVLYFHSKGITHFNESYEYATNAWRIYLEYFVIHNWQTCIHDLDIHDCVGAEWVNETGFWDFEINNYVYEKNPHYAGNFWWSNAKYISKLNLDYIYNEERGRTRWRSELWIGTQNPNYKSYHNSNKFKLLYDFPYSPNYYIEDFSMNKNNNISLEEIAEKYGINSDHVEGGTDKNTSHSYFDVYEELFSPYRDKNGSILEIGVYRGGSFILWSEYFKNFQICGLEVIDKVAEKVKNIADFNRINFSIRDAYNHDTVQYLKQTYPDGFDIIIDDGPHTLDSQINCIELYLDILKEDGLLIIEDIQNINNIETLISSIPISEYFNYEYTNYDLRGIKGRYDDILFVIKKIKKDEDKNTLKNQDPKVFIITPCTRPFNLDKISQTIPTECEWIVSFDQSIKNDHKVENCNIIKSPYTGFRGNPNKNFAIDYIKNDLNPSDNDWIYVLHDDNIIHPDWYKTIREHLNSQDTVITWGQCFSDESPRLQPVDNPQRGNIDTSQYMVKWSVAKNLRFEHLYEADGIYAEEAAKLGSVKKLDQYLGYYNFLRSHKKQQEIPTNICMISMFKNESKGIRRMLESVWRHIDFYVLQDNGSTDGTPEIVEEFFKDKNIPGFIYKVEEGWVSFGWNRDHLLQTTLRNDHGCDWIMKMDCDEYLEVDDDFDWSPFYDKDNQSFNVVATNPGCIYYRAWIWNANLPWKFKHDVAHECIYIDDGITGESFQSKSLPRSLRMCGTNDGESYTVRTKYISDALKLEEKLIREETMLTDRYHFWYTAKSYMDCFRGDFYPLEEHHSREFARRAIFYFEQYIDVTYERGTLQRGINEMCYFATFCMGECYKFLGDIDKAIYYFKDAESFCPVRNEHLVNLAYTYSELGQYDKMLEITTRLVDPARTLPFPDYYFLININLYHDSGSVPHYLHNYALQKVNEVCNQKTIESFSIHPQLKQRLWIVDNFYDDPYAVREFALSQQFEENIDYYKGKRTKEQFIVPGTKEAFEKIIGRKIINWTETHGMCGRFQYCTAQDDLVYHCDGQTWAGMIYLTPDAPFSCGTSLFAHKETKLRNENDFGSVNVFGQTGFYDRTKFELVDTAGNVFNRLVLFDAKCIHSANEYFGTDITNSRLFHLFFFD